MAALELLRPHLQKALERADDDSDSDSDSDSDYEDLSDEDDVNPCADGSPVAPAPPSPSQSPGEETLSAGKRRLRRVCACVLLCERQRIFDRTRLCAIPAGFRV